MSKASVRVTSTIFSILLSSNLYAQSVNSVAEFDGSTLTLPAMKFGESVYKNLKLSYEGELDFAYQNHSEEIISDQKTNSIFDGQKVVINLIKAGDKTYSNLILVPKPDGKLTAQSADTPLPTQKLSTLNRDTSSWIAYKTIRKPEVKKLNKNSFNQSDSTYTAIAYLDIDMDGDDDIFVGTLWCLSFGVGPLWCLSICTQILLANYCKRFMIF